MCASCGTISQSDRKRDQVDGEKLPPRPTRSEDPATDPTSYGSSTGGANVDPCPQRDRSSADGGSERGAWTGEPLRLLTSGIVHLALCQAVHSSAAARSGSGTRPVLEQIAR